MSDSERASYVKSPVENRAMQIINNKMKSWLSEMHRRGNEKAEEFEKRLVYWGYETNPITPKGIEMQAHLFEMLGTREDMKIRANATPYPSVGSSPTPAPESNESSTPEWMQEFVGAR